MSLHPDLSWPDLRRAGDLKKIFCSFASFGGRQVRCCTFTDVIQAQLGRPEEIMSLCTPPASCCTGSMSLP